MNGVDRVTFVRIQGMDGKIKYSGSKQGGFYIGQVSGSRFICVDPILSLTQKQSKHAGVWAVIEMA